MVKKSFEQHMLSSEYKLFNDIDNSGTVLVLKRDCFTRKRKPSFDHPRPVIRRTRILSIKTVRIKDVDYWCIECSCGFTKRSKCGCRHFYSLVKRLPTVQDFYPECLKSYELRYGNKGSEEYTKAIDNERTTMLSNGGGLLIPKSTQFAWEMDDDDDDDDDTILHELDSTRDLFDKHLKELVDINTTCAKSMDDYVITDRSKGTNPLSVASRTAGSNAYSQNLPNYEMMMKLVTGPEQQEIVTKSFNQLHQDLLKSQINGAAATRSDVGPNHVASYPNVETAPRRKRIKSAGHS